MERLNCFKHQHNLKRPLFQRVQREDRGGRVIHISFDGPN